MYASDVPDDLRCLRAVLALAPMLTEAKLQMRVSWTELLSEAEWCRRLCGIYVVRWPHAREPRFNSTTGAAHHARPETPATLALKWEAIVSREPTDVLCVGRGDPICARVRDLVRFGVGRSDNHAGGEWMWQVDEISSAEIVLMSCPTDQQVGFENAFLERFENRHKRYPLANRDGPEGPQRWWPGES